MVILEVVKSLNDKTATVSSLTSKMKQKKCEMHLGRSSSQVFEVSLEREKLLSKNTGDPTVGSLRDEKENCSTRRGLRVGTGFASF